MARSGYELGALVVDSLWSAGIKVAAQSRLDERPVVLVAELPRGSVPLRVFVWNATPGGPRGVRATTEFRVQTTRPGTVPLQADPSRATLLLGYHEQLDVFAAWDVRRHPNPGGSSSLQVALPTLEEAAREGFASQHRVLSGGDEELVIAFQPEAMADYLDMLPSLSAAVDSDDDLPVAERATQGLDPVPEDLPDQPERRIAVRQVATKVRDVRFRRRVLMAYHEKCAFCGSGLGLVDAAHAQSVEEGGPDVITNGFAACPTHHRAYDRGAFLVNDDYSLAVNRESLSRIGATDEEAADFADSLFDALAVPATVSLRPDVAYLRSHRIGHRYEAP